MTNENELSYRPAPTVERFMLDPTQRRCLVGPLGSGKSMGCIMELLRRAVEQKPAPDGVRYTRSAIIRNTGAQLRTTVLADIRQYISPLINYFVTDSNVQLRLGLDDGTQVHADWYLIPLDTKEDQRRLLSLQLTSAWINEIREVPIEVIDPLCGRIGRYPSGTRGRPSWSGLIADSNPWGVDSPYHDLLVLNPHPLWKLFRQPSGISPAAENRENLKENYYEDLAMGRDRAWISVHVEGEWGDSNAGQAVFRTAFEAAYHVKDFKDPRPNPFRPLMVGLDFGRTPTAVICQADAAGRLIVFEEVVTEGMGLIQMVDEHLKPVLTGPPYAGLRTIVVGDPAGNQLSQIGEESPFDVLRAKGFAAIPASTNLIEPRLRAVERLMRTTSLGEPSLQINRAKCPTLIRALSSEYRYKKTRDGRLNDLPDKNHPWSDVADALQYAALGVNMNLTGRVLESIRRAKVRSETQRVRAAGWT